MKRKFLSILLSFFFFCTAYPYVGTWVPLSLDDIKIVDNPLIESKLRLAMIRKATKSIDIVIWDQQTDPILGLPLLLELNRSAQRGVKIRFVTSWQGQILQKEFFNLAEGILNNPPVKIPVEFIISGGLKMRRMGWGFADGIHQKILIIDNQLTMATGRGHSPNYLKWMDTAFIFKGPLVNQTSSVFDRFWKIMKRENGLLDAFPQTLDNPNENMSEGLPPAPIPVNDMTNEELDILNPLLVWLDLPAKTDESSTDHSQPKARVLYHDFLDQLRTIANNEKAQPVDYSYEKRLQKIQDPVVNEIMALLAMAKDFKFCTLSLALHPELKKIILQEIQNRGLRVELFTNGKEAHSSILPLPFPVGWYSGLMELDEILMYGVNGIEFNSLGKPFPHYLHRKLAVIDDVVIFGSHNLSMASSVVTDEVSFEIKSPQFAEEIRNLFYKSYQTNGKVMDKVAIHEEHLVSSWYEWLSQYLKPLY